MTNDLQQVPEDYDDQDWPELPPVELDIYQNAVDLMGDIWRFLDPAYNATADWSTIPDGTIKRALKHWIAYSIRVHAPRESSNQFNEIKALLARGSTVHDLEELDLHWWRNVRSVLRAERIEYRLHRFRRAYIWMADVGLPGSDDAVADAIEEWIIPGNVKGEAVKSHDRKSGPLSDDEREVLVQIAYSSNEVSLARCAMLLCIDLGCNPKNLILLEERDLHVLRDPRTDQKIYQLSVPRIKKRLAQRATKRRQVSVRTGEVIEQLIAFNRRRFDSEDPKRPILCRACARESLQRNPGMARFAWHLTVGEFTDLLRTWSDEHDLRVPGAKEKFTLTPRRLRYTLATVLLAMGASKHKIAELLDHSDTQHVGVYIEAAGQVSGILSRTVGPKVEPVYEKFLGKVVNGPEEANPTDARAHIHARLDSSLLGGIGTCGSGMPCKLSPPISCYICPQFQAWARAPHAKLGDALRKLLERLPPCASASTAGEIQRVVAIIDELTAKLGRKQPDASDV